MNKRIKIGYTIISLIYVYDFIETFTDVQSNYKFLGYQVTIGVYRLIKLAYVLSFAYLAFFYNPKAKIESKE
jgi:hypothetical protein